MGHFSACTFISMLAVIFTTNTLLWYKTTELKKRKTG